MDRLLVKAKEWLENATGLIAPPGVSVGYEPLEYDVAGKFRRETPRLVLLNPDHPIALSHPRRVMVHELSHLIHYHHTQYRDCTREEVERFAVCATFLVDLMKYGKTLFHYDVTVPRMYREADAWFVKNGPDKARRWMEYVLCF